MKYFANYMSDAVVREDEQGNRYVKSIATLKETPANKDSKTAWGGESYGVYYFLEPISREEYDGFGVTWEWSQKTGKRVTLIEK